MLIACKKPLERFGPGGGGALAIEARDLTMRFAGNRAPALDGLSLDVPQGVIYGILGPNGAGKTTLLSILCGLLDPTSGSVRVGGRDMLADPAATKRGLGVVPNEPALYPTLSARENLEFFGRMQGLSGARLEQRVQACLDLADIGDQAGTRVEVFSSGFKRRLNLVIGLIHEPQIIILDEPTVAIDPLSRSLIHQRLRELHAAGVTIVFSTHYMEEAEHLCHSVAILNHGRIVTQGEVDTLLAAQRSQHLVMRLGRAPSESVRASLRAVPGVRELSLGERCLQVVAERPEQAVVGLLQALRSANVEVESFSFGTTSLEQVFLSLTGEDLVP